MPMYSVIWASRWSRASWTCERIQSRIAPGLPFCKNTKLRFGRSFDKKQLIFCPPPPRRSTGDNEESEPLDSERSALGNAYNMAVHFAVGHMRRWDGAYPALNDGAKAVDWFAKKGER